MFARDVFPEAAFVAYCEWWYRHPGPDVAYLAALEGRAAGAALEAPMHERARNAPIAMDLAAADAAICPTASRRRSSRRSSAGALSVMHDGIDTDFFRPDPAGPAPTARRARRRGRPRRHLRHPRHGAAPRLPAVHGGAAGDPRRRSPRRSPSSPARTGSPTAATRCGGSTGRRGRSPRTTSTPPGCISSAGSRRADYLRLLRRSDAHVYLTVPFVLSWSMLEAMSAGCALVLSDTEPVREFADAGRHAGRHGRPARIAAAVLDAASSAGRSSPRRRRARAVVERRVGRAREFPRKQAWLERLRG